MNRYREIIVLCTVALIIMLCILLGPKKTLDTVKGVKNTVTEVNEMVTTIDEMIENTDEELKILEKYKDGNND